MTDPALNVPPEHPPWRTVTGTSGFIDGIGLCYAVYRTTDEYGCRGKRLGFYPTKEIAKHAAERQGWYGGEGAIVPTYVIKIGEHLYELASPDPIEIATQAEISDLIENRRQVALSKLTQDERKLLGLDK